ncbi:uncharacterized protein LOC123305197 isoform X2 [Chrysoperla carnea]|uniref:uncharacterized protein LOC123305197 isoform X2 n=1 Tax=Chrysoperla carnea TaxID=189513 RepID=UPI001D075263|nr:uncharacterized protein LOC123305197 isoform X2 [Chrysoperla carnea]
MDKNSKHNLTPVKPSTGFTNFYNQKPKFQNGIKMNADKIDSNKFDTESDDIESLLTVHVMCKTNKPTDQESATNNTDQKKVTPITKTIVPKNVKNQDNLRKVDKKSRQIVKNKISGDHSKPDLTKYKNVITKKELIGDVKALHNTRRNSPSYLKIRVKSQEALGLNQIQALNEGIIKEEIIEIPANSTSKSNEKALNVNTKTVIVDDKTQKRQCRLCGSLAKNCVQFLNEKSNEFLEKVTFHLNVEIKSNDGLPQQACVPCVNTVTQWAKYYNECALLQKVINKYSKSPAKSSQTIDNNDVSISKNSEIESSEQNLPSSVSVENMDVGAIKKEEEVEDAIEKMLREMHGMDTNETIELEQIKTNPLDNNKENVDSNLDLNDSDDDFEMDVEFLEEERELVDEALSCQKVSKNKNNSPQNNINIKSEPTNGRKVIRMDLMKVSGRTSSALTADIDKHYKDFKDKLTVAKDNARHKEDNTDKEYYDTLAKSYSHHALESVQTDTEMFFRCPDCRVYLPSTDLPRHMQVDHGKTMALCDFCRMLFPYDSETNKNLIAEHIELHKADKMSSCPEVILNISKLLESLNESPTENNTPPFIKQEDNSEFVTTVKKVVQKNRYRCNQCSARFQSAQLIREHLKLHETENVQCLQCNETFTSRYALNCHEKLSHTENKKWICEFCSLECDDEASFDIHMKAEQHLNPCEFVCPHCSNIFTTRDCLAEHIQTHSQETFTCDTCGFAFVSRTKLQAHQKTIHVYTTYSCTQCEYKNFTRVGLKNHVRIHHKNSSGTSGSQFPCNECNLSFHTANRLREHVQKTHQTGRNFHCPLCDWSFNHNENLKKHFEFHVEKGHTICKVCQQPFECANDKLNIIDVIEHKKKHTTEENFVYQRPYSPSVSRMTPWRDAIPPQGGARMFCRDCGVACSIPLELRKHQKTHKPYYCNTCQTVSNNEQTFILHMEQHADRKHVCKTCGKRFMTRTALNLHSRIHQNVPKFSCAVCSRKFRIVTDWKRHERSCRETHGWPRMDVQQVNQKDGVSRRLKRSRRLGTNQFSENKEDGSESLIEYVDEDNITYEYAEDDSMQGAYNQDLSNTENLDETTYVEYVVQEGDDTIEIDETQLAEFQEWQRTSQLTTNLIKSEAIAFDTDKNAEIVTTTGDIGDDGDTHEDDINSTASVYYSIEELPGVKKQYRFVPQYVIQGDETTGEHVTTTEDGIEITNDTEEQKFVIPEDGQVILNDLPDHDDGTQGGNVVYVDSASNIVYNLTDNMGTLQNFTGQNIIFQHEEEASNEAQLEDGENISYVFNNATEEGGDESVTIYLKGGETVNETLDNLQKVQNV